MSYLKHFPIDTLKIDQSFVFGLEQDPANQAILKAIVSLGHNLGLKVIAEGVETDMEREFLVSIGCDELQGFLFSKPMAVPDLEAYIHSHA
jgi:EAL domain-containing protein (putative c-di-GMP-specific phosphodiesterase class I)